MFLYILYFKSVNFTDLSAKLKDEGIKLRMKV